MVTVGGGAKQCFIDLAKADTSGDYEKALRIANKVLRNYPKETIAFKCKLASLIHLGRLDDALTLIKKTPPHHMGDCLFEKAYIQYRQNNDEAALETLSKAAEDDFRCAELKAQLFYRAERFEEAENIFKTLLKDHSDEYDEERRANLLAVLAQLHASGVPQQPSADLETFEQMYNGACHLIEDGKYQKALELLEKAEKLCNETLTEEGMTEEEIEEELSVIRAQKGFVLQKSGKSTEALKIYLRIQDMNPSERSVFATVNNNIPTARDEMNLLEARKRLKSAMQVDGSKLTNRQRRTILLNQALVHLHSNQREPCRRALDDFFSRFGSFKESRLIEAALHVRTKDYQKAFAIVEDDTSDEARLTALQILIDEGKLEEACDFLSSSCSAKLVNYPAILQLRIALLLATNKQKEALELLNNAVKAARSEEQMAILEELALLNTQLGDNQSAVECLQKLSELRPNDTHTLCRLIKAYATFDIKRAEELLSRVFPLGNTAPVDVDALERSKSILYGERYRQKKETKPESAGAEIVTRKRAHKRKRKVVLPKNFDPKMPPDPERWLPKQERSAYKKKLNKKHRDRDIGRGTQGAIGSSPNIENAATNLNSPKATTPAMGMEGPRQQRPAGQQPKKKKKKPGNKW